MSHSPPFNYTDGVPVKISEKYKQPPDIHLPTKLTQQLLKTKKSPVAFVDYNFDLERKIISKTTEWINWRMKERTERQQRIQQRELLRQKRLEEEHKAKLDQVSYPSTEDLSENEDDEKEKGDSVEATTSHSVIKSNNIIPSEQVFSPNTILLPTQAVNLSSTDNKTHRRYASNSSNKIDFSFFESDASPFDNLEIKSMNEMEELAKVLKSTAVTDENALERNNSSDSDPPSDQLKSPSNNNNNNNSGSEDFNAKVSIPEIKDSVQSTAAIPANNAYAYNPQQLYNNYYYGMQSTNQPFYNTQQQQQHFGTPTHSLYGNMQQPPQLPNNCYYTQNYAVNHMNYALNMSSSNNNNMACESINSSDSNKMDATKSRSVPDIVKELSDELNNSERRRIRNISQCNQESNVEDESESAAVVQVDELSTLPAKSQILVRQVCQMGFSQDIVIRALKRLGDNNNKKVVEHLISLNEILQMGFEEEKISEALIKFDNNKDQALDYLIS